MSFQQVPELFTAPRNADDYRSDREEREMYQFSDDVDDIYTLAMRQGGHNVVEAAVWLMLDWSGQGCTNTASDYVDTVKGAVYDRLVREAAK